LSDYKFSLQTQELSRLWNRLNFKFCTIKYIWKSLIHGYFFLKEFHSEILHNYVISTQIVQDNCSVMVSMLALSVVDRDVKHGWDKNKKNLKLVFVGSPLNL
jgi:hypothetical protein